MKRFFTVLFISVIVSTMINAQGDRGFGLSLKALLVDYESTQSSEFEGLEGMDAGFELGLHKRLTKNWEINVPFKYVVINQDNSPRSQSIAHLDAQLQYHFVSDSALAQPYFLGGLGYAFDEVVENNIQVPLGLGVNVRVAPNMYVNAQGEYRYSFSEDRNNVQFGLGIRRYFGDNTPMIDTSMLIKMAPIDSDQDGVTDDLDNCPETPGLAAFAGCPDTDGDGIEDAFDACPAIAGPKELKGCPDTDGDGVSDPQDACPKIFGSITNNGCPDESMTDSDGDGVPDKDDRCPSRKGEARLQGCPDSDGDGISDVLDRCPGEFGKVEHNGCPDSDGDGIPNPDDRCPYQSGLRSNRGCPDIKVEDREILNTAMRAVQFEHGKSTLKRASYPVLDQVVDIMNRYGQYSLSIDGHTDNTGNTGINQQLSERRAKRCYDYLISKGISQSRMSYRGYGETQPIASNDTQGGRALNRRVEFNIKLN